jgi:phenylacetate-CoA ligase
LLVTDTTFDPAELPNIERGGKARLGESVTVEVSLMDEIPPEKSGKYRYVVSRVETGNPNPETPI